MAKGLTNNLSALLMTPVQRVTRYPLLLNEINNLYIKAKATAETQGINWTEDDEKKTVYMKDALSLSYELCTYVNDMMEAGRILKYPVSKMTRRKLFI